MTASAEFNHRINELKKSINKLDNNITDEVIEQTAARLEGFNYAPPVITPIFQFLRMDRQALQNEVDRILSLPDQEACFVAPDNKEKCEDLRLEFLRVLLYYYEKLLLLRQGNAEEWDEIDELYLYD